MAAGIWFLIKNNLGKPVTDDGDAPPRAFPVDERTLEPRR